MTIYISGAISSDPHYKKKFKKSEKKLRKYFDVINPAKVLGKLPKNTGYATYMDLSLEMVKHSDLLYMLPDWTTSRGARLEYDKARELGIPMVFEK